MGLSCNLGDNVRTSKSQPTLNDAVWDLLSLAMVNSLPVNNCKERVKHYKKCSSGCKKNLKFRTIAMVFEKKGCESCDDTTSYFLSCQIVWRLLTCEQEA